MLDQLVAITKSRSSVAAGCSRLEAGLRCLSECRSGTRRARWARAIWCSFPVLSRLRSMILSPVLLGLCQTNWPQVLDFQVEPLIVKRLVARHDTLKRPDHAEEEPK